MPRAKTLPVVISAEISRDKFDVLQKLALSFGTDMISVFEHELQSYLNQQVEQRLQLLQSFAKIEPTQTIENSPPVVKPDKPSKTPHI